MTRSTYRGAALWSLLSLASCAPVGDDPSVVEPQAEDEIRVCRTIPERATRVALETASEGLLYMSESDRPFDYVSYPRAPVGRLTPAQMLSVLGLPARTAVEVRTFDRVFNPLTNPDSTGDDAPRFVTLKRTLQQRLTYIQVFAVGTIQVQIYIVGRDRCGTLVGLHTVSIET